MKKVFLYIVLAGFTIGIIGAWWHGAQDLLAAGDINSDLIVLGRLLGLTAAFLLPLQLILIGRVKWVETVFGLDKLSRLHRTNGLIILALILAHPIIIIWAYSKFAQVSFVGQYLQFLSGHIGQILQATIGVGILLATIILSLTIVRKKLKYEWWYYVHVFNYVAIFFIFLHVKYQTSTSQYWEWPALWIAIYILTALNVIWFRFTRPILLTLQHQFAVGRVEDLGLATSIYITGKNMEKFHIDAGQFMIFRFLQNGFWLQAHPFSMSEAPNGHEIRLTAKKLGDFTKTLPQIKVGTRVIIDGPHGVFTEKLATKEKLLFIAGGIGITPIRSMFEDMGTRHPDKILLFSNKSPSERILGNEVDALSSQNNFKIIDIFSDTKVPDKEYGRLDKDILARLVPDIKDRDIFLCGPPPMLKAIRAALSELGVPKSQIHFERFAL